MPSCNKLLDICNIDKSTLVQKQYTAESLLDDRNSEEKCAVYIEEGKVDVFSISPDGKETLLSTLSKGDIFGINNLFLERDLCTLMQCKTDCTLIFIPKQLLRNRILSGKNPMEEYARLCNEKIQFLLSRIEELSLTTARTKLANFLCSKKDIANSITRHELASILGISRAALFREMSYMQEEKIISINRRKITILDNERLKELTI